MSRPGAAREGMKNARIAGLFNEIADLLELKGENPFRIQAYRRAALTVEGLGRDVASMSGEELRSFPGIGKDLADKIRQAVETGRIDLLDDLGKEIPRGLLDLIRIPNVGPKTARMLHEKLAVTSLEELEALARAGKLSALPKIKEKTEENILKGIALVRKGRERFPIGKILPIAREIEDLLRKAVPAGRFAIAGSIRRWKETIKDIDVLAAVPDPDRILETFVGLPVAREVLERGPTRCSILTHDGVQVDLRVVEKEAFGAALQYFTGSKAHSVKLREIASRRGLKINEYGIFREKDGRRVGGEREEDVYTALRLPFIPPELREDTGEIEAALEGTLPDLVTLADIRGDLHAHTKWSDGSHDLDAVVQAARDRGYRYIAITDHSKGLGVARGLDERRVLAQASMIDEANRKIRGFRIFKGIEVDIRGDGSLDMPDEILEGLDVVAASIHSGFRQPREQITGRLLAAIRNPRVTVIAHPTGRIIGERDPYDVDMEAVIREAARCGKALEINANPSRLDLSDHHVRLAKEAGVPIAISTDMHHESNLDFMAYGVSTGRRGWLARDDVLNTLDTETLARKLPAMRVKERTARR
jgi:DNA polymerase (family X)